MGTFPEKAASQKKIRDIFGRRKDILSPEGQNRQNVPSSSVCPVRIVSPICFVLHKKTIFPGKRLLSVFHVTVFPYI